MRVSAVALVLAALLVAGCSSEAVISDGDGGTEDFMEGTLAATTALAPATGEGAADGSLATGADTPDVTLRLEGDPNVSFSGYCYVGYALYPLSGEVPETFEYDLEGQPFSCSISKESRQSGSLRVILVADGSTRSVQQTDSAEAAIDVSYSGS